MQDRLGLLVGKNSEGIWELTVGDNRSGDGVGQLDAWGIGFGQQAPRQVQVLAGATTVVTARLVGISTPLGDSILSVGERLSVSEFGYSGGGVVAEPFEFTGENTEVDVTLTVSVQTTATGVVLFAFVPPSPITVVEAVPLGVRIMGRLFSLAFMPPEIEILVGAEVPVERSVTLTLPDASLLPEDAVVPVTLSPLHPSRLELLTPTSLEFSSATPSYVVEVRVLTDAGVSDIALRASVATDHGVPDAVFADDAELQLRITREVGLRFETLEGEALAEARVLAGGATRVAVALQDPEDLMPGEAVRVTLSGMGVTTDVPGPTLTRMASSMAVSIAAAVEVRSPRRNVEASGMVLSGGSMVAGTRVVPTSLALAVVPRRFRLELGEVSSDPGDGIYELRSPGLELSAGLGGEVRSSINVERNIRIDSVWLMVSVGTLTPGKGYSVTLTGGGNNRFIDSSGGSSSDIRKVYSAAQRTLMRVWVRRLGEAHGAAGY